METIAREDISIGEDLTPPLPPLASSLYNSTLSSHCSACFSPLTSSHFTPTFPDNPNHVPQLSPHTPLFYYCSPLCCSLDSTLHFFSAESHLLHQSAPSTCPESSELRLSLRLLSLFQNEAVAVKAEISENDSVLERIGGLMTNRERLLLSTQEETLRKFVDEEDDNDDDVLERIKSGAKAMAAARRTERGGAGEEEETSLCATVLCLVMTNAVEVQDKSGRGIGVAVYDTTFSWINHSCSPNACYRFSTRRLEDDGVNQLRICPAAIDGGDVVVDECGSSLISRGNEGYGPRIILRSVKAIKKGEAVTITYTDLLQPKAMRQSELWSKYRFDCFCEQCRAVPPTYVDQALLEIVALALNCLSSTSDHDLRNREMIKNMRDCYDDAITEYLSHNNPESCCQKLEKLLIHGQINKQPEPTKIKWQERIMLHPFHHLSLNAYMTLASAYKVRANDLLELSSQSGKHHTEAFNFMRFSAAYSLMLAGATHHLFRFEASLIVSVANFWISAGESLLNFARSQMWDLHLKGPTDAASTSPPNYKCNKCSLLDQFYTASICCQEQDVQFEDIIRRHLICIVDIKSKLWTFLSHGTCYLKVIKDPIDFSWLTNLEPYMIFDLPTRRVDTDMKYSVSRIEAKESSRVERVDVLQLGVHCLLFGAFLSRICYGQHSHLMCNVRDILKSEGVSMT